MTRNKFIVLSLVIAVVVVLAVWFLLFRPELQTQALETEKLGGQAVLNELRKISNFYASSRTEDEARLSLERYNDFLEAYPDTLFDDQIKFFIGHIYQYHLHDNESAQREYEEFIEKYPDSKLLPLVQEQMAKIL